MNAEPAVSARPPLAFRPVFVLVSSQLLLLTLLYYGSTLYFRRHFLEYFEQTDPWLQLYPYLYWFGCSTVLRMIIPMLLIKLVLRENLRDFGYRFKGTFEMSWVYLVLAVIMVPLLLYASSLTTFQATYPFCKAIIVDGHLNIKLLIIYEIAYAAMFMSGESFWRGYILFGLEKHLGYYAIFVMIIPYSMSHFGVLAFGYTGKPFLETIGSLVAGTVLGYLALRHRSFWLGVALHWYVAVGMDLMAVWRRLAGG